MKAGIALIAMFCLCTPSDRTALAQEHTPEEPPALALEDLDGSPRELLSHRGRIVILNFWATWCRPCLEEMPLLSSIWERYRERGVDVIGASTDDLKTRNQIPGFVRRTRISFPVWTGATVSDMVRFGLGEELPATAIIDRNGAIVARIIGMADEEDLATRIEWLLGDRESPAPPDFVDNLHGDHTGHDHDHHHDEDTHHHGGVGIEGASMVPS